MKECKRCGKILTTQQRHNDFCSQECANLYKQEQYINDWKKGKNSGMRENGIISNYVRNYLLKIHNYKCEKCGWGEVNPTTNKVPLEIHHIDGNYLNSSPENLQVLCPNCHSLTPNYKALNKEGRNDRTTIRKNYCIDCGEPINSTSTRCRKCADKAKRTEKPINREELKKLIRNTPFTTIGKIFNVSDNAIRKWCASYGLPSRVKDIKTFTDEQWELL